MRNVKNFSHSSSVYFTMTVLGREVTYNVQRVNLPGISFNNIELSKTAQRFFKQGDTPQYNSLTLDIILDENLEIWKEIVSIFQTMTKEGDGDQELTEFTSYLHIYNEKDQSILRLEFIDCVFQNIGDVEFDTSGEDQELILSLTIDYAFFEFEKEDKIKEKFNQKDTLKNTIVSENYNKFKNTEES